MNRNLPALLPLAIVILSLAWLPGCASYQAYEARFRGPDYTVTPEFFRQSPRRVAIFPFAARSQKRDNLERAQVCRVAFYQHFSVRDFEDVEMRALDDRLLPPEGPPPKSRLRQFSDTVRKLDVVGLTSFVDFNNLLQQALHRSLGVLQLQCGQFFLQVLAMAECQFQTADQFFRPSFQQLRRLLQHCLALVGVFQSCQAGHCLNPAQTGTNA